MIIFYLLKFINKTKIVVMVAKSRNKHMFAIISVGDIVTEVKLKKKCNYILAVRE